MVDWSKTAFIFPGQGSQIVGMGADFAERYPIAHQTFEEANDILGMKFSEICFADPDEVLNETQNTQPALYITSIAILRVLQDLMPSAQATFTAGHSLGEFTALFAANSYTFSDGLKLVRRRGELMNAAGESAPGAMAAILGIDTAVLKGICETASSETKQPVVVANDNCPGQTVISGDTHALDRAIELANNAGARKSVKLAVSVAAHSPLMASVSDELNQSIQATELNAPQLPVYANVSAQPMNTVEDIRDELNKQLTQTVRWSETIQNMIADGAETFIEIGSQKVLTGLMRRIDRSAKGIAINTVESLEEFIETSN